MYPDDLRLELKNSKAFKVIFTDPENITRCCPSAKTPPENPINPEQE